MPLPRLLAWLLLLPSALLLGLVFLLPLGWFLGNALGELGSGSEILSEALAIAGSRAMQRSMLVTGEISLATTLCCLAIGYPLAFALTRAKGLMFRLVIASVLLPYFTSVIVRTYAWMVLLGRTGVVNNALQAIGVTQGPLSLLYNRGSVILGMTYVLLPYMVLTLFSAMRSVDMRLLQAAAGMGASGARIFLRVFLPLTLHGVIAGSLLVFILAIGFFITPALMGAPEDMMVGMLIERQVEQANNWPVAAVMSLVLLAVTMVVYAVYSRFADIRRANPA
ncbi:ABC transporter permease [Acidisphaera sp. L21]|uniref:ABC transporter permease n=1 Tax=Acidisphaera sp. L21 TaxID=1641851 RepID=UPI00131CAAEF|nr:ABC transporter permease [Acidisphaera sp. L21]